MNKFICAILLFFILGLNLSSANEKVSQSPYEQKSPQDIHQVKESPTLNVKPIKPQSTSKINPNSQNEPDVADEEDNDVADNPYEQKSVQNLNQVKDSPTSNVKPIKPQMPSKISSKVQNEPDSMEDEDQAKEEKTNLWSFSSLSPQEVSTTIRALKDLEHKNLKERFSLQEKEELAKLRKWHHDYALFVLYKKTVKLLNAQKKWAEYLDAFSKMVKESYEEYRDLPTTAQTFRSIYENINSQAERQLFAFEEYLLKTSSQDLKTQYLNGSRLVEDTKKIWSYTKEHDKNYTLPKDEITLFALSQYDRKSKSCDSRKSCLRVAEEVLRSLSDTLKSMKYSSESIALQSLSESLTRISGNDRPTKILTLISKKLSREGLKALDHSLKNLKKDGKSLTREDLETTPYEKFEKQKSEMISYNGDEIQSFENFLRDKKGKNSSKDSYSKSNYSNRYSKNYDDEYEDRYTKKRDSRYSNKDNREKKDSKDKNANDDEAVGALLSGLFKSFGVK